MMTSSMDRRTRRVLTLISEHGDEEHSPHPAARRRRRRRRPGRQRPGGRQVAARHAQRREGLRRRRRQARRQGGPWRGSAVGRRRGSERRRLGPSARLRSVGQRPGREAGLSPAELHILQSLGARRGQLDQREQDIDVQLQLLSAAEAKLDAKVKALNGLKGDIQGLLGQADTQKSAEVDRMVTVFSSMKPKDAAARMTILDDSVRLPIAAKMKERTLSMILANMAPVDAKNLTERLANRFAGEAINKGKAAIAENGAQAPAAADAQAKQAAATPLAGAGAPKKAG
jgi:flagellar motility protein MotE (MotC chaperone)